MGTQQSPPNQVLIGLALSLCFVLFEGLSIRTILKALGTKIGHRRSFVYAATDIYYSSITPSSSGGQPMMLYYMGQDGVHLAHSGIATLFNLVAYKIILLTAGVITLIYKASWINENGSWLWWVLIAIGFTVTFVLMLICVASIFSPTLVLNLGTKGLRFLGNLHLVKNAEERIESLTDQIDEYREAAHVLRENKSLFWKVLGYNLLQRMSLFSITYCVYLSFGGMWLAYYDLLAVQVICSLAIDMLPLPGGMGAAEMMTMALYGSIYPEHMQTPAMLLTRGINFYFSVMVCAVVTFFNHVRIWRRTASEEEIKL